MKTQKVSQHYSGNLSGYSIPLPSWIPRLTVDMIRDYNEGSERYSEFANGHYICLISFTM